MGPQGPNGPGFPREAAYTPSRAGCTLRRNTSAPDQLIGYDQASSRSMQRLVVMEYGQEEPCGGLPGGARAVPRVVNQASDKVAHGPPRRTLPERGDKR